MQWMRRLAALLSGALMAARFAHSRSWIAFALSVIVAILWAAESRLPARIRSVASSCFLVINVALVSWAAVGGAFRWWLVVCVSLSLGCWNAREPAERRNGRAGHRGDPYAISLGAVTAVGLVAVVTAMLSRGLGSLGFAVAFVVMVLCGVVLLFVLPRAWRG